MGAKMTLRTIIENHVADSEIEFLTKSISKLYGRATARPTATVKSSPLAQQI